MLLFLDGGLKEVYMELSDTEKLALCTRDKSIADVMQVASKINIDVQELDDCFYSLYQDLLDKINELYGWDTTPESLKDAVECVINQCIEWWEYNYSVSSSELSKDLNSKGD